MLQNNPRRVFQTMPTARTVDEMIMNLPKAEQVIVKRLRALVQECLPQATEKGYYGEGVPFYTRHRMICFIWPGSVFWGPKRNPETQKAKGVSLGFCQGNLMANEDGVLQAEGRKQVYVMYFHSLKEISEDQVRALLFEAAMIDDSFGEKKKRAKKK
jgi:hypothetical protein